MMSESAYSFYSPLRDVWHGNPLHLSLLWITNEYESTVEDVSIFIQKVRHNLARRADILSLASLPPVTFGYGFSANVVGVGELFRFFCRKMDASFTIE